MVAAAYNILAANEYSDRVSDIETRTVFFSVVLAQKTFASVSFI